MKCKPMDTQLTPLDEIFDKQWLSSREELQYPLGRNQDYKIEVNNWLQFFDKKGWLDENLIQRLRHANNWSSYYAKMNELRAGYFFEKKLGFNLIKYEVPTEESKNVEFEGEIKGVNIFIEVKTPLDLDRKLHRGGWFNNEDKIYDVLDKATEQLPHNAVTIVVLSNDLNVSLFSDPMGQDCIWTSFNSSGHDKVSAVCILGDIYHYHMYEMLWAANLSARKPIDESIFDGFKKINKM